MQSKSEVSNAVLDVLANCTASDTHIQLPDYRLDPNLYRMVKGLLNSVGGKWVGGKVQAFEFSGQKASKTLADLLEAGDTNPAKSFQFFPTPDDLADQLVEMLGVDGPEGNYIILEPSAGDGALIKALWRKDSTLWVDAYEAWGRNRTLLQDLSSRQSVGNISVLGDDFLAAELGGQYDRIIANPPFAKNADIAHVMHMLDCLKVGGRLVAVMSTHWQFASDGPSKRFRKLVESMPDHFRTVALPAGSFKESNTGVNTCMLIFQD